MLLEKGDDALKEDIDNETKVRGRGWVNAVKPHPPSVTQAGYITMRLQVLNTCILG